MKFMILRSSVTRLDTRPASLSTGLQDTTSAPWKNAHHKTPPATGSCDTPGPSASHKRDNTAPPSPATPAQHHAHIDVDAPDLNSPGRETHTDPEHPPLTPTTISNLYLLGEALQGRPLDAPLGWYRLQESWNKLTVKAVRDLATPGQGLHEAIGSSYSGGLASTRETSTSRSPPLSGAKP